MISFSESIMPGIPVTDPLKVTVPDLTSRTILLSTESLRCDAPASLSTFRYAFLTGSGSIGTRQTSGASAEMPD